jgi:hypothetical protein
MAQHTKQTGIQFPSPINDLLLSPHKINENMKKKNVIFQQNQFNMKQSSLPKMGPQKSIQQSQIDQHMKSFQQTLTLRNSVYEASKGMNPKSSQSNWKKRIGEQQAGSHLTVTPSLTSLNDAPQEYSGLQDHLPKLKVPVGGSSGPNILVNSSNGFQ